MKTRILASAVAIANFAFASLPAPVMAATWQMWEGGATTSNGSDDSCVNASGTSMGNSYSCSAVATSDPVMTVTAWSTTDSGQTFAEASVRRWAWTPSSSGVSNTPIQNAGATTGYDYGVVNANSESSSDGQHSLDNKSNTDVLALNFTEAIALTSVSLGWISGDADISILRYVGPGTPPNIDGKTVSGLTSIGGWELVGHYANLQNDITSPSRTAEITNAGASSWWLVSAFNPGYGSGSTAHGGTVWGSCYSGLTCGNDYVKLLQVAGNVSPPDNKTPEPGSMVLFGAGLLGMMALRRRREAEV